MADVFISYSRRDQEFVRELVSRLTERGKECWVDWDDIPPTAAFLQEIYEGIDGSNAFLFVISPDSARSEVCRDEIEHAAENNKRIVPLLRRDPDGTPLPEAVASLNWIPIPESADLDGAVDHLVEVLAQDLEHARRHTRSLQKAREWSKTEDTSLLLRGAELRAAEEWIEAGAEKEPAPTPLHYRYLQASRAAAAKRQRQTIGAFAVGIVIALALAVVALIQRSHAVEASHVAQSRLLASEAQSQLNQHHLATGALLALAAYRVKQTHEARFSLSVAVSRSEHLRALLDTRGSTAKALAFAPTGSLLAAGLKNGTVLIYGGPQRRVLARLQAGGRAVTTAAFSRDGRRLVAGTAGGSIALWRVEQGPNRVERLPFHARAAAAAFDADQRTLVLGTDHGLEWRRPNGTVLRRVKTRDPVDELAVAPDGKVAYANANELGAHIVSPRGKTGTVPGAGGVVQGLAFDPTGQRLALVVDQNALLWTLGSPMPARISAGISALAFGSGGELLTGGENGDVATRSAHGGHATPPVSLGEHQIQSLAAGAGSIVAASSDGLALWDLADSELQRSVAAHGHDSLLDLVSLPRGRIALATQDDAGETHVGIKDLRTGAWRPLELLRGGESVSLAVSADGRVVAAGGVSSTRIKIWSSLDPKKPRVLDATRWGLKDEPVHLALGPDARTLVQATDHKRLDVWALDATQRPTVIPIGSIGARVAFAPSGTAVAVGESDGHVSRVPLSSGRPDWAARLGGSNVSSIAFSPDGARIAAADTNGVVAVWRPGSSRALMLSGGTDSVDAIDFDPSGPALAAGDAGGGLYLWDARTGAPLAPSPTLGEQEIVSLHFDPSGRVLEAGLTGGRVVVLSRALWDPVAAIHYLCARLDRGLRAQELAVYHVPGSAASKICS